MHLVNLVSGISVRPEKVDFLLIEKSKPPNEPGYIASVISERQAVVGVRFDTPAEAEQIVDDWTARINGDEVRTRVPSDEDLDAKARLITDEIAVVLESRDGILNEMAKWDEQAEEEFLDEISSAIREYLGDQA